MIEAVKYPITKKYQINAIYDNGGFAQLEIVGNINLFSQGQSLAIFVSIFNGVYQVIDYSTPSANVVLVTINKAYSATGTGYCFINSKNNSDCNFHAVNNTPTLFQFQRRDIEIYQTANLGGKLNICLSGDWSSILLDNGYIFVKGYANDSLIYNENAIITDVVYHAPYDLTWVLTDIDYVQTTNYGFVNSNVYKANYSLSIRLNCSLADDLIELTYYPDPSGVINCDISTILNNLIVESDSQNYQNINYLDINKTGQYEIEYKEIWTGTDDTWHNINELICFIFARVELLKHSNLFKYIVKDGAILAKWLNKGVPNIYVKNGIIQYPVDFSILCNADVVETLETKLDEGKNIIENNNFALGQTNNYLNRITLQDEYSDCDYIELSLDGAAYGFAQFVLPITSDGKVQDSFTLGYGILRAANCLDVDVTSVLSLPEGYVISNVSHQGTCTLLAVDNTLTVVTPGTLYDLSFEDADGFQYHFVCADRVTDLRGTVLIHGERNILTGSEPAYMVADNVGYSFQNDYFGQVTNGMDVDSYSGDYFWINKNSNKENINQDGLDNVPAEFLVPDPYFDVNTWVSVPQNSDNSGFNAFDQITYMPNPFNFWDLSAYGISDTTEWTYDQFVAWLAAHPEASYDIDGDGIITNFRLNIGSTSEATSEKILIKNNCDPGGLYFKWFSLNGCYEYELFENNSVHGVELEGKEIIEKIYNNTIESNEKNVSIGGKTNETIEIFKMLLPITDYDSDGNEIDNFARYQDLKKAAYLNDIYLFVKKFICNIVITDYDGTIPGTCKVTCSEKHLLNTGDKVRIFDTDYSESTDFEVYYIDEYNYYINLTFDSDNTNLGYHQKLIENNDWLRCSMTDCELSKDTQRGTFDITLTIMLPSYE